MNYLIFIFGMGGLFDKIGKIKDKILDYCKIMKILDKIDDLL